METPPKINHELRELLWAGLEFIIKNIFGLLSALTGFIYSVYRLSDRFKRMTKIQCITSICMSITASIAMVIGLAGVDMNRLLYGFLCWATPFVIKQIADIVSIRISPITEKAVKYVERFVDSFGKKNT